jgi:outer membrane protein, heavy metal efflux system
MIIFILIVGALLILPINAIGDEIWTLDKSVQYALERSPRVSASRAEVSSLEGALTQAGVWPNPELEISGSEKLGIEDGSGGSDFTEASISQPIPFGRLPRQQRETKARLAAGEHNLHYDMLLMEHEVSLRFHMLQLRATEYDLANKRLESAEQYQKNDKSEDPLVRYLAPLEKKRLDIVKAVASQKVASAEGEYNEALSGLVGLLNLSQTSVFHLTKLQPLKYPRKLEDLLTIQKDNHPAIIAARFRQEAANAGIALAQGEIFEDPILTYFRERDFIGESRQDVDGLTLSVVMPIWDLKKGSIKKARSHAKKAEHDLRAIEQMLEINLRQSHLHLGHLIEQAEHYHTEILVPAKEIFELTNQAFKVGEVNVLSLVDANNVYFESLERYQELLYESAIEAADLRLAAGLSLINKEDLS